MLGKKNMNDTAHARSAGGYGFRLRAREYFKSWTFASHLNWPVPPSSDNNRNICPGTDNPLQPLSNMPEVYQNSIQKMK
jgi:hypothetical protein